MPSSCLGVTGVGGHGFKRSQGWDGPRCLSFLLWAEEGTLEGDLCGLSLSAPPPPSPSPSYLVRVGDEQLTGVRDS